MQHQRNGCADKFPVREFFVNDASSSQVPNPTKRGASPAATANLRNRESNVRVNVVEQNIFRTENPTEQLTLQSTKLFGTKVGHVTEHS
jgi:hypothetical protein